MRKSVLILVALAVLLAGCDNTPTTNKMNQGDDTKNANFEKVCDIQLDVGMLTFSMYENPYSSNKGYGYGYAVRMTDDEYARYCGGDGRQ